MHKSYLYILLLFLAIGCTIQQKKDGLDENNIVFLPEDKQVANQLFEIFNGQEDTDISVLMVKVGIYFSGSPYVSHTLEVGDTEKLVVNLREFDCNTFAENCLALSKTIQEKKPSFEHFIKELQHMRYHNGVINGYPSRLHYFSDWIHKNHLKKVVKNVTPEISATSYPNQVNFMSTHPESYKQLKNNQAFIEEISKQEQEISANEFYYIPKEKIEGLEEKLQDGDIVGITTNIKGLDISHVGIIIKKSGRAHLLHASSTKEKVVITENPLADYLMGQKHTTGIMLARPI